MVKLSEITTSFGRNGTLNTIAIDVSKNIWNDGKTITISPITSKNVIGKCSIEIPVADIPKFIKELKAQL
jgi:hypothetical protein